MMLNFAITLYTALGEKQGVMLMKIENLAVQGFLHVLGKEQPFEGKLDENGNCVLSGQLVTPVRTIYYTAAGTANENHVELFLQTEHDRLYLYGIKSVGTGGDCL